MSLITRISLSCFQTDDIYIIIIIYCELFCQHKYSDSGTLTKKSPSHNFDKTLLFKQNYEKVKLRERKDHIISDKQIAVI